MQTASASSKVTSKYQTVVPAAIREQAGIEENQELFWQVTTVDGKSIISVIPKPKDWVEYIDGLGKEVWEGVDTDKYIRDMRSEQDR